MPPEYHQKIHIRPIEFLSTVAKAYSINITTFTIKLNVNTVQSNSVINMLRCY